MIFGFLHRHLPAWLATPLTGVIYAALVVAVWLRSEAPDAPFRYVGL